MSDCPIHPGTPASSTCSACQRPTCERCLTWDVDGNATCEACGERADERSRAIGSALLLFVGVAYLAALAVALFVFHGRPFVGGLSAVVALVVSRALQAYLAPPVPTRRDADAR